MVKKEILENRKTFGGVGENKIVHVCMSSQFPSSVDVLINFEHNVKDD